jgi:hypothetical protein
MLIFLHKLDKLRDQAFTFYQEIEREYSTDIIDGNRHVVHTPMNIPMGTEGMSTKPFHADAFRLARAAFALTDKNPNELGRSIKKAFVIMEEYQSDAIEQEDIDILSESKAAPLILEKFNAKRLQLVNLCQELTLDMTRLKECPEKFTSIKAIADVLEYFAIRLVDEKRFACTPAMFDLAKTKLRKINDNLKGNTSLPFWFNLKDTFERMTSYNHHGFHSSDNLFVELGSEDERANKLATMLLPNLSKDEAEQLKSLIATKYLELQEMRGTMSFNFKNEPNAITPAFNLAVEAVPTAKPVVTEADRRSSERLKARASKN